MLNSYPLNTQPINGDPPNIASGNIATFEQEVVERIAEGDIIFFEQSVSAVTSGNIIDFEQRVARYGAGNIIEFNQEVNFSATGSGNIITFEQEVQSKVSGNIIAFEQRVVDTDAPTKFGVNDWDLVLTIGGFEIPKSKIHGGVKVTRSENDAALLTFTLLPLPGNVDPVEFQGKTIHLNAIRSGKITRIYTGIIDIPEVDMVRWKTTYRCTDRRNELVSTQLRTVVNSIGYFSEEIFGERNEVWEQLENRLTTVPLTLDFDAFGNHHITSIFAKATPDFVLNDADVYRRTPTVEVTSRSRLINKVNINFEYRFQKGYQRSIGYNWVHPASNQICRFLFEGYSLIPRQVILNAAQGSGWETTPVNFTPVWPAGFYRCFGTTIAWSPIATSGQTTAARDENGNVITDENGNVIYNVTNQTLTDTGSLMCRAASWAAARRWTQNITESYNVTVTAPQSINQYGQVERNNRYGVDAEFDSSDWASESIAKTTGFVNLVLDFDVNRSDANNAYLTAVNIARTTILRSHRDNKVTFQTDLWPEVDLKHTVQLNCERIQCKGKVSKVEHFMDISTGEAYTEVELSLSRSIGSASDTSITIPPRPIYSPNINNISEVALGNFFGELPSVHEQMRLPGAYGNRIRYEGGSATLTQYPVAFVVDTPDIEETYTANREVSRSASYNIQIPNDSLTLFFDGKRG